MPGLIVQERMSSSIRRLGPRFGTSFFVSEKKKRALCTQVTLPGLSTESCASLNICQPVSMTGTALVVSSALDAGRKKNNTAESGIKMGCSESHFVCQVVGRDLMGANSALQ